MKTITKALVGTIAAGAMVLPAATPALARDRHHDRDGISAGEVIAGALVIGGIAAAVSASSRDDYRGYDRDYRWGRSGYGGRDFGYDRGYMNPREAIERCVRAAEKTASRYSYGRADVTDIRDIDRTSRGYVVKGRIAVNAMGHGWHNGDGHYGRGWNNDYRGWNSSMRGYDSGTFRCEVAYGRVTDLDFGGIRGL